MDRYYIVIILTFLGFMALAAILLVPVYLFLKREEDVAEHWTDETAASIRKAAADSADRTRGAGPADRSEPQPENASAGQS